MGWPVPTWLSTGIVAVMGLTMMGVSISEFRKTEKPFIARDRSTPCTCT